MYNLINTNFSRSYNPTTRQNALCDIKRLLTSRDTIAQSKACGYLIEVISKHKLTSNERKLIVENLLDNDIIVFLCEATSNLDFSLFRSVLSCVRLLWRERRFFAEEHAAHAMAAGVRALAHYSATGCHAAVDACLHFICDLLNGISLQETTSPLSIQSAYSTEQLIACLKNIAPRINTNSNTVLCSALVLHALVSYQPATLTLRSSTSKPLVEVLSQWFELLLAALNHMMLVGDSEHYEMFLVVLCQILIDSLRLIKIMNHEKPPTDFVQNILTDNHEINLLKQCASEMNVTIQRIMSDLVVFVKDNESRINSEEYAVFLKLLLQFLYNYTQTEACMDLCDILFSKGYLTLLPQNQISRNDVTVRKISILVLGEMLKALSEKYLLENEPKEQNEICANDIQLGLVVLQSGIEKPENIGVQLQKSQPYSLLIYIYFYCQSSENPEEITAPLLPYLVDHILRLPKSFKPPPHIVKALWLVFAMATISNGSLDSLNERVYLEKATCRLILMLQPNPSAYYTHNPAILFWAFTSQRIPNHLKIQVLSQWLKTEDSLPEDLVKEPIVWELLLDVLVQSNDDTIVVNCRETLDICIDKGDSNMKQEFADLVWEMMPEALSKSLIDCESEIGSNVTYLLDIATALAPTKVNPATCLKIAVLTTTLFSKNAERPGDLVSKRQYEHGSLKLCLLLLGLANDQKDQRVLLTYMNRAGFLPSVLTAMTSVDDGVACAALKLLSYVVFYFAKNNYQPKSVLQIQTDAVIKSLRRDSTNDRGSSLLQLLYMTLSSGSNSPLVLNPMIVPQTQQAQPFDALRALMFRIQLMLCCRDSKNQSSIGWKTLDSIFKHAILKSNPKLVATLTSQAWTYTLIRFQLTQNITQEFLSFTSNWLTLLKITIKKGQGGKFRFSKYSLITRTLFSIKKNLATGEEELKELHANVLKIVNDILEESCVKI